MTELKLKEIHYGGITLQIPEVWNAVTETYKEEDGRCCAMIDITAEEGDPRSIIISYGPMPEGSDALMEASGTYESIIEEIGPEEEEDPICEYDFLGSIAYGFEVPTEDNLACNFICLETGNRIEEDNNTGCKLLTIMTTARTYEEIDELLDLIEEKISIE